MHNVIAKLPVQRPDAAHRERHFANRLAASTRRAAYFWRTAIAASLLCLPGLGLAVPSPTAVQPLQPLRALALRTVRAAAPPGATLVAHAGRLDARLRLPVCGATIRAAPPNLLAASAVVMVPLTCTGAAGWTVRVPIDVAIFRKVLVATQAIGRGSVVEPGEFTVASRNVTSLGYGYLMDAGHLAGRRTQTEILAGTVITPSMLAPAHTIRNGQTVRIVAHVGNVEVREAGVAMVGGGPGDVIRVKSAGCQCMVQGTIEPDGTVAAVP